MKRVALLIALLLIFPLVSGEIIINSQPKEVYSLGDMITIPATIKTSSEVTGIFEMNLICSGGEINFYRNGVSLTSGEEKRMESTLVLTRNVIGELKGTCKIKAFFEDEFVLTNDFTLSNLITLNTDFPTLEFKPGQSVLFEGEAIKENGQDVNGYIQFKIIEGNASLIEQGGTINNGLFSINVTFPSYMEAKTYLMELKAYEEDINGETTNKGFTNQNIIINQVPTSLEIVLEDSKIEPGTNLVIRAVLHDQTGKKIESMSYITIKNEKDKVLERADLDADDFFEFPIPYNQAPTKWTIVAMSNELTSELDFEIIEKADIEINIANTTIKITNIGNVVYNKTVLVKIGEESLSIDVLLEVGKSQRYLLSAPDGNYEVEVITDTGDNINANIALTGKSIDVKKASSSIGSLMKYPFVWLFIILILAYITFISFKRGYQKKFVGYIKSKTVKRKEKKGSSIPLAKTSLVNTSNKAELSLSIKGDKQNISIVGLHIKNLKEMQSKKGETEEIIQGIINSAEDFKAATYESQSIIFFIIAPTKTKTFKNEKTALDLAQKIKSILDKYNQTASQKVSFGISLNYGTIIAKQEDTFKFMSMGTLMATSKKLANLAHNEILLSEKINDKLKENVKTTRHEKGNMHVYSIKEVKDAEGNKKFVKSFLERIEGHHKEEKKEDKEE